jgi:hypothetical protein
MNLFATHLLVSSLSDLRWPIRRSRQKPRFLPAATKPLSEKRPQAVFPMLQGDLGFEDGHGLSDDPDTVDRAILDFQLHVDPSGTMQLMALYTAE